MSVPPFVIFLSDLYAFFFFFPGCTFSASHDAALRENTGQRAGGAQAAQSCRDGVALNTCAELGEASIN